MELMLIASEGHEIHAFSISVATDKLPLLETLFINFFLYKVEK